MTVIPGMPVDNTVNIIQEVHINGLAVAIGCAQADAEQPCMQFCGSGLLKQRIETNIKTTNKAGLNSNSFFFLNKLIKLYR